MNVLEAGRDKVDEGRKAKNISLPEVDHKWRESELHIPAYLPSPHNPEPFRLRSYDSSGKIRFAGMTDGSLELKALRNNSSIVLLHPCIYIYQIGLRERVSHSF